MDIEKLKKNAEGRGFSFRYFDTGAEAADYLTGELAGMTVGFGGSGTLNRGQAAAILARLVDPGLRQGA